MAELAAGRDDAITVLFERYKHLVLNISRRVLENAHEAEDNCQQVFLEVFRSRSDFNAGKGLFNSWLRRRAFHRALTRKEHLTAHRFYVLQEIDANLASTEANIEEVLLAHQILERLSPRQQEIIALTFYEGMTAKEVSEHTGYTLSVVRHDLYNGLAQMRSMLRHEENRESNGGQEKADERKV